MGIGRLLSYTDTGAPQLQGTVGSLAAVLKAALVDGYGSVAPLGWTLEYSSDSYKAPWVWWHDEEYGDTCGVNGLAADCPPHLQSDVGHELANQSGTFGLLWYVDKDNRCKCSLRSNGDYDVSAIAKVFGGGGHRNAAGFTTDIQTLLGWTK